MKLLSANQYQKVAGSLKDVGFNTIFASIVVEGQIPGKIFVDDIRNPGTFLIAHPYGMSLLFGSASNDEFNDALACYMLDADKSRTKSEWLEIYPNAWKPVLERLLGPRLVSKQEMNIPTNSVYESGKVMEYTRVNFRFNLAKYVAFKTSMARHEFNVIRTDGKLFMGMQGSVIPKYFWRDADHFLKDGVGYTLMRDGEPASTAFSAFMNENQLEIGIETMEKYRGMGLSQYVCSAMIDHSLVNGYEPIWSCRLENVGSYRLAQKLGFEPTCYDPYYQLVNHS